MAETRTKIQDLQEAMINTVRSVTPPVLYSLLKRFVLKHGTAGAERSEFLVSEGNVKNDDYLQWIWSILGGFLDKGCEDVAGFDYAVRRMPAEGAMIEIGSFLGLSTNMIAYLALKYKRDNPFFTCDPWVFEKTEELVGGYFDASSLEYREWAKSQFIRNVELFSSQRKPHTIEAFSHEFLAKWHSGSTVEDVFGRKVALGGPISFAFIDGAHTYEAVKADFIGIAEHLAPEGLLFFHDSADYFGWEEVSRLVSEVKRDPAFELLFKTPHYMFRKRTEVR